MNKGAETVENQVKMWTRSVERFMAVIACVIGLSIIVAGQTSSSQRGFQPAASYALADTESINTTNGNLMLHVPMASLPAGRGGSAGARLGLVYNSKIWETQPAIYPNPNTGQLESHVWLSRAKEGNWRYAFQYEVKLFDRR